MRPDPSRQGHQVGIDAMLAPRLDNQHERGHVPGGGVRVRDVHRLDMHHERRQQGRAAEHHRPTDRDRARGRQRVAHPPSETDLVGRPAGAQHPVPDTRILDLPRGRILAANDRAHTILRRGDGLWRPRRPSAPLPSCAREEQIRKSESSRTLVKAEASRPKCSTGAVGWTDSGVPTPMRRTVWLSPGYRPTRVSPSGACRPALVTPRAGALLGGLSSGGGSGDTGGISGTRDRPRRLARAGRRARTASRRPPRVRPWSGLGCGFSVLPWGSGFLPRAPAAVEKKRRSCNSSARRVCRVSVLRQCRSFGVARIFFFGPLDRMSTGRAVSHLNREVVFDAPVTIGAGWCLFLRGSFRSHRFPSVSDSNRKSPSRGSDRDALDDVAGDTAGAAVIDLGGGGGACGGRASCGDCRPSRRAGRRSGGPEVRRAWHANRR